MTDIASLEARAEQADLAARDLRAAAKAERIAERKTARASSEAAAAQS